MGVLQTAGLAQAAFERWIDLASYCPIPVRITDLEARLVYANAAWRKLTNLDQARSNVLGWLDVIQPFQRTEVLGRLLDPDAPADQTSLVYALTCGQSVCELLSPCHDHQGRSIGHIAFISRTASTGAAASNASSKHQAGGLNAYGPGQYNPTIHAAAALVNDVSLPLMATTAYVQAAQNHIASGLASDLEQAGRTLTHAVQDSVQAISHLRRLRAVLIQGQPYFERSDLCALLKTVIADCQTLCQQLGVSLEVKLDRGPCMASLQASQIYMVLKQLIGHCLEHSRRHQPAKIFVELEPAPQDHWQITIGTEGLQIPTPMPDWDPNQTSLAIASARAIIRDHDGKLITEPSTRAAKTMIYRILIPIFAEG
jgi:hypothetical protein